MQLPDQTDLLARLGQAESQLTQLKADYEASVALAQETEARLTVAVQERDNARAAEIKLTEERDSVTAQLAAMTAERDTLKTEKETALAQLTDFNTRVASEVKRLGLGKTPAPSHQGTAAEEKLTPTQQVLLSKGVNRIEELK